MQKLLNQLVTFIDIEVFITLNNPGIFAPVWKIRICGVDPVTACAYNQVVTDTCSFALKSSEHSQGNEAVHRNRGHRVEIVAPASVRVTLSHCLRQDSYQPFMIVSPCDSVYSTREVMDSC